MAEQRGFDFPCEIPIKAMGPSDEAFPGRVTRIVARHVPVPSDRVRRRPSRRGRYQSVTVTVRLESRAQLEAIYADLHACEEVLWTL